MQIHNLSKPGTTQGQCRNITVTRQNHNNTTEEFRDTKLARNTQSRGQTDKQQGENQTLYGEQNIHIGGKTVHSKDKTKTHQRQGRHTTEKIYQH